MKANNLGLSPHDSANARQLGFFMWKYDARYRAAHTFVSMFKSIGSVCSESINALNFLLNDFCIVVSFMLRMLRASSGFAPDKASAFANLSEIWMSSVVALEMWNFRSDAKRAASVCWRKRNMRERIYLSIGWTILV